ncbi:MAG TPA: 2-succinyl-6-hydroxy-2,4-cyclohexadiene-1-carboxylate synthase [Gemmatimonadaceae bacterium]
MDRSSSGARHDLIVDAGDGLELHSSDRGSGSPLILVHGFTGSGKIWEPIQSELSQSCRVLSIDLPGHGKSSVPEDPARYALDRFADDLVCVLDAGAIDRAVLIGYSLGGRAAMRFALRHADRLSGLVLESASPGIDSPAERAERLRADHELADFIEREGIEAFVNRWESLPLWETQRSLSHEQVGRLRSQRLSGNAVGLANSLRGAGAATDDPVLPRLHEIDAPVLLIAGELDRKYAALAAAMHRVMKQSRLRIIEGAGHAVHLEKPDEFVAAVSDFVKELEPV